MENLLGKGEDNLNKTKFVIIAGEGASGKDSVLNILVDKYGYHKMVSYTTRPPRKGEINGYDYFFLNSNEEFEQLLLKGAMFEKTEYQTATDLWLYGLGIESVKENEVNVVILNPHGIEQLKKIPMFENANVFYITADTMTRIKRYINRDNIEDYHKVELIDRLLRDDRDFNNGDWKYGGFDYQFNSEWSIPEEIANQINLIIDIKSEE